MNKRIAGFIFLGMTLIDTALVIIMSLVPGFRPGPLARLFLSELIMIIPCMAGWLFSHDGFRETFAIKKVRVLILPACVVLTWLLTPLVAFLNVLTLTFTENEAGRIFDSLSELPFPVVALFAAVIAPFFEEWTFRGVIYGGLRKNGSALQAAILSALMFGIFHMNINQALYAFMLGLFFAMLREITGSIWPSVVCHISVNAGSVIVMGVNGSGAVTEAQELITNDMLITTAGVMLVVSLVTTVLALALIMWIADKSGDEDRLARIFKDHKKEKGSVISIAAVAGTCVCIGSMIAESLMK